MIVSACREAKEREQRRRRGLPSESEDDEEIEMKNGDPFKKYSKAELDKKVRLICSMPVLEFSKSVHV